MDANEIMAKFQSIYGVDITQAPASFAYEKAIKTISEAYPKVLQGYVESIAGQTVYEVSDSGLIKVVTVFYDAKTQSAEPVNYEHLETMPDDIKRSGYSLNGEYSLIGNYVDIYSDRLYNKMNPVDAKIIDYNRFECVPAPKNSGIRIYYEYNAYRTIEEIPDAFEDCLFDWFSFYDRDGDVRAYLKRNNGNQFTFDRRGMGQLQGESVTSYQDTREFEMKTLKSHLREIVLRMS